MIITIKNLQQQTFHIELDPEQSVLDLKEKIENDLGTDYPAENQKLIYAGNVLANDKKISSYNVTENKFIVVMVSKPAAPQKSTEEAPKTQETAADATTTTTASTTETTTPAATPAVVGAQVPSTSAAESAMLVGNELDETVNNIVAMGYERANVLLALQASFNNPDRAVEYLITGIPNMDIGAEQVSLPPGQAQNDPIAPAPVVDAADPLAFLRDQPRFNQMRGLVRSDPQLLDTVLREIGDSNPQLLQLISDNQEAFLGMLNEPIDQNDLAAMGDNPIALGEPAERADEIILTPQDRASINRLTALGFAEDIVVQAYFACEKNEILTANLLLSNTFDDNN